MMMIRGDNQTSTEHFAQGKKTAEQWSGKNSGRLGKNWEKRSPRSGENCGVSGARSATKKKRGYEALHKNCRAAAGGKFWHKMLGAPEAGQTVVCLGREPNEKTAVQRPGS